MDIHFHSKQIISVRVDVCHVAAISPKCWRSPKSSTRLHSLLFISYLFLLHPTISLKRHSFFHICHLNHLLRVPQTVFLLGLSVISSLCCSYFISEFASRTERKVGFLFRTRYFFTPVHLLLCKAQISPTLEYYSHVWGGIRLFPFPFLIGFKDNPSG